MVKDNSGFTTDGTGRTAGLLSVVIPVHDEEGNIDDLALQIDTALDPAVADWECVWVDDGSADATPDRLRNLVAQSRHHRFVRLDRGYGQSAALAVGFEHARGEIIVTLDGDGQNPPREIPALIERLIADDLDMVCGYRRRRFSFVRTLSSRIANGFRNALTGESIRDVGCSLRAFRAECVRGLFVFRGMHRFLPTLVRINGYHRIVEVPVDHEPRSTGRSKYGINNRLWVGIADTFAVRWMARRAVRPAVSELSRMPAAGVAEIGGAGGNVVKKEIR